MIYLCFRITLKTINGQGSHQNDFKYHLIVNMLIGETYVSKYIFYYHAIFTFPGEGMLQRIFLKSYFIHSAYF